MSTPKKFNISIDSGVTWLTFPGDTADMQLNGASINDTVFGASYASMQPGMINWTMSANGFYKGFAGYVAKINKGGTPTVMTGEACTLVSGKTYQITNSAHRWISYLDTVTVKDNGVNQNANVQSIDYLFGTVTFKSTYTPTTPITIDGKYLPMTQVAQGQSFTLTQTSATVDKSTFNTAQANSGLKVFDYGLKTVALDISGVYSVTSAYIAGLEARSNFYVEINPDGQGYGTGSVARGIFKPATEGQSGKVAELEVEATKFTLFVPDPGTFTFFSVPFEWNHAGSSTLSTALQNALTSWQNGTLPQFQYLYDGTNGQTGSGVLTDLTLTGGLEVMNTFAVKVQGSDTLTAVGTG